MKEKHWLERRLADFEKWYSLFAGINSHDLWKKVDRFRHEQILAYEREGHGKWPKTVFLGGAHFFRLHDLLLSASGAIEAMCARHNPNTDKKTVELESYRMWLNMFQEFLTLAPWRPCKDIVSFDSDLFQELGNTAIGEKLPSELLEFLPGWSLYFDTPGIRIQGKEFAGFFASLRQDGKRLGLELDFQTAFSQGVGYLNTISHAVPNSICIPLNGLPLAESLAMMESERERFEDLKKERLTSFYGEEWGKWTQPDCLRHQLDDGLLRALNMVIYVCAFGLRERQDYRIGQDFREPRRGEEKFSWRIFEAPEARIWNLGGDYRLTVREWQKTRDATEKRGSIRPHMRRSHWHGFWTGSKTDPDKRRLVVKLLPPIFVRGSRTPGEEDAA